jgi:hypothetical protein
VGSGGGAGQGVIQHFPRDDPWLVAIERSLEPFAWRRLSTEMLARYVVAALDRQRLRAELGAICDPTDLGGPLEPAAAGDERVGVVVHALNACPWRSLTSAAVAEQALRALQTWRHRRDWLDIELSWLLDAGG